MCGCDEVDTCLAQPDSTEMYANRVQLLSAALVVANLAECQSFLEDDDFASDVSRSMTRCSGVAMRTVWS